MCDFQELLHRYANTIPSTHLLFRVSKPCGYSQLVVVPRGEKAMVQDLVDRIRKEMGEYTTGRIFFYSKHRDQLQTDSNSVWNVDAFHGQLLAKVAVERIPLAYSIDECQYAVYQLNLNMEGLSCDHSHSEEHHSSEYEPTREELLSLLYEPITETSMDIEHPVTNVEQSTNDNNNNNIDTTTTTTTTTTTSNQVDYVV